MGKINDNNFCFFTGGGMKFMVVSLEFAPTGEALAWAGKVNEKKKHTFSFDYQMTPAEAKKAG